MKTTNLLRSIPIASATSTETTLTIDTTGDHKLVTGDTVYFDTRTSYSVTVIDVNTFTIPVDAAVFSSIPFIPSGVCSTPVLSVAGVPTRAYSIGSSGGSMATFQAVGKTTSGTGSAAMNIEVSNNGINWLTYGTISLSLSTTESSDGLVIAAPWAYARVSPTAISGTGARLSITMGTGS